MGRRVRARRRARRPSLPRSNTQDLISCYRLAMRSALLVFLALATTALFAKDRYLKPGPIHLDREGEKWAEKTLHKLSTEEKVGQLFMVWVRAQFLNTDSETSSQLRDTMKKYHVGSFAMTVPVDGPFLIRS